MTTSTITREQVLAYNSKTLAVAERAADLIACRFAGHPNVAVVQALGSHAIRVEVKVLRPVLLTTRTVYLHVIPWSRGWAIFASYAPTAGAYDWRLQPRELRGLQTPLYAPRGKSGAWTVPAAVVANAAGKLVQHLLDLDTAARARVTRKHWYWPTTTLKRALSNA